MSRAPRLLLATLLVGAAAVAAIFVNLLLLGHVSAQNDPVGRLTPRAALPQATPSQRATTPSWTIRPAHGEVENRGADD